MDFSTQIKYFRKEQLNLTRAEFGKRLGVSADVVNNLESKNRIKRPEQKAPLLKLICDTFNVRYEWLTTGEGDIYVVTKQSFIEKLSAEYGLSMTGQKIIECYLSLCEEQRDAVDEFIKRLAESISETPPDKTQNTVVDSAIKKMDNN